MIILDVINASSFWGRIVEHSLPHDHVEGCYDTTKYLQLYLDMQMYYSIDNNRTLCTNVERFVVSNELSGVDQGLHGGVG